MKIRIKFAKTGAMRFIGHLDIMRYFQKAVRRAEIDIAYSGGYSPHQVMSFAAPLGVGLTSNGEYLDIEVLSYTSPEDMKKRLNAVMAEGMVILNVTMLSENVKNAMASVAAAEYTVSFREGHTPDFDWESRLMDFYHKPSIPVIKTTKKSKIELDLKPAIHCLEIIPDKERGNVIRMLIDAGSSGNIKPGLIIDTFMKENDRTLAEFALIITREDTYTNTGTEENPVFVPLDKVGCEFG